MSCPPPPTLRHRLEFVAEIKDIRKDAMLPDEELNPTAWIAYRALDAAMNEQDAIMNEEDSTARPSWHDVPADEGWPSTDEGGDN
jgi:hypothetical protein